MTGLGSCHVCGDYLYRDSRWIQDKDGLWCRKCYYTAKGLDLEEDPDAEVLALLLLEGRDLSTIEKLLIQSAIKVEKGNLSRAAKRLGIGRATIYRKMGPSAEVKGDTSC